MVLNGANFCRLILDHFGRDEWGEYDESGVRTSRTSRGACP